MLKSWKQILTKAEDRGKFIQEEIDLAFTFKTCPIGEKFNIESRQILYVHFDGIDADKLDKLAVDFMVAVRLNKINEAKQIYNKIQELKIVEVKL